MKQICALVIKSGIILAILPTFAFTEDMVIDAVVASVDGKPITLQDLRAHLSTSSKLSLQEASADPEARYALDEMILETLITAEAESRKMTTSDAEIEQYVDEIAKRNNLTRAEFEKALKDQKKTLVEYKKQVRLDILKSRLASSFAQGGVGIGDDEVEAYMKEHSEVAKSGAKLTLAQIFIKNDGRSPDEFQKRVEEVTKKISDGDSFASLAKDYSDSSEAHDGGSLGVLAEGDLSSSVFDAVFGLKEGETSKPVSGPDGIRFFNVEKRFVEEKGDNTAVKDEVRKLLQKQKADGKMQSFFTTELYRLHSVDKKI